MLHIDIFKDVIYYTNTPLAVIFTSNASPSTKNICRVFVTTKVSCYSACVCHLCLLLHDQWKPSLKVCGRLLETKDNTKIYIYIYLFWIKQPHCYVEVGCLKHPGASTTGSQLHDGDCTDGWQNLTIQPWAPHAPGKMGACHIDTQWKVKGGERRKQKKLKCSTNNAPTSHHTDQ